MRVHYQGFMLVSVYLTNSTQFNLLRPSFVCVCVCMCVIFFFVHVCVCHQTRQCMMLSAAEDMRTTIYNSPLSQLRHTVLPHGAGACLCVCVRHCGCVCACFCVCNRVGYLKAGDCERDRQSRSCE